MIKKVNIALAVAFVALLAVKGLKGLKDAAARSPGDVQGGAAAERNEESLLAPCVCYGYWAGYTLENPISNRNGVLLDIVRAIFPKATYRHVHGGVDECAKFLREDARTVVIGFGAHPDLTAFPSAPTPLMYCPLVLMTLRTNPWHYKDFSSLLDLRIVSDEAFLDYKVIRDLRARVGADSGNLRLLPSTTSKMVMAEMVSKGEADAFVMADLMNAEGAVIDSRFLQRFRKSKIIANDGTLLYVSGKDADFAKRVVEEYEAGVKRIEKSGERRRIFEYYGIPYEPVKADCKVKADGKK